MTHPQRKSPRLHAYDYAQNGAYFVTICTHDRAALFGHIIEDEMILNAAGRIAEKYWGSIPEHFSHVELDMFVVMPNHVHGILVFGDGGSRTRHCRVPTNESQAEAFGEPVRGSLSTVVRSYKSIVTREFRRETQSQMVIWQSRFHDHIVRNEGDLHRIREYVVNNPANSTLIE